jgi:hypothetical protein
MVATSLFTLLAGACSSERLAPYQADRSDIDALTLYAWNIALSEALYPCLQNLEIGLRNRMNSAIQASFGDLWWFQDPAIMVGKAERDSAEEAEKRIRKRGETLTASAIVSEVNFGFWSGLLTTLYDPIIWTRPNVIVDSFPYASGHNRTRRNLFRRFDEIRQLRNRVFHHEAIWHLDLNAQYENIIDALGWLDPSLQTVTKALDRFPEIHTDDYLLHLKEQLMRVCPIETKIFLALQKAGEPLPLPKK